MSSKKKEVAPVSTNDQNGPRPEDMKSAANFVLDIGQGKTLECNDSQVDSPSEEEEEVWDTEEAHQEHFAPRPRRPTQEVRHGAEWVGGRDEDSTVCISEASNLVDPQEQEIEAIGAILVDPKAQERRIEKRLKENQKDIPLAQPVLAVPWYKRQTTICFSLIILLIILVVAIAVPLSNQNSSGSETMVHTPALTASPAPSVSPTASPAPTVSPAPSVSPTSSPAPTITLAPTVSPAPTHSPTASPAPTTLAVITMVLQLDEKPWETGWKLECDRVAVNVVPPGTYALLTGRFNFRVQHIFGVNTGADCQLTITDTGGDGIEPGYFAIYNGFKDGGQADRITAGNVAGSQAVITFVQGSTGSSAPIAAPNSTMPATRTNFTVCPDGTPVPFKDAPAVGWEGGPLTCEHLDLRAANTTDPAVCRNIQDAAAAGCGCRNFCTTMCPDRVSGVDPAYADEIVFFEFDQAVTCEQYQTRIENARANSRDQCLSANFIGEDVCGCPRIDGPFCRICDSGVDNPATNPPDWGIEIIPGVTCRDITVIAYTLRRDDPSGIFEELCPASLSIGAYCGCGIPDNGRPFCRLCGGSADLLPEPSRIVDSSLLRYPTTCFHIEFLSNINDNLTLACDTYREDAAAACCTA